jgi:LmbE family N-acetylglucosaminyl deacetylase
MINLLIVAHPDDEVLGFGGTGAKLVENGEIVQPVILCANVENRSKRPSNKNLLIDLHNANKILGFRKPILGSFPNLSLNTIPHFEIVKFIEEQIKLFEPDRVFTHHPSDLNDDHQKISYACQVAARLPQRNNDKKFLARMYVKNNK